MLYGAHLHLKFQSNCVSCVFISSNWHPCTPTMGRHPPTSHAMCQPLPSLLPLVPTLEWPPDSSHGVLSAHPQVDGSSSLLGPSQTCVYCPPSRPARDQGPGTASCCPHLHILPCSSRPTLPHFSPPTPLPCLPPPIQHPPKYPPGHPPKSRSELCPLLPQPGEGLRGGRERTLRTC